MPVIFNYPEPRLYRLHKLLFDLYIKPELRSRYLKNPEELMREYGLRAKDVEIMKREDLREMFEYGINNYLLFYYFWLVKGRVHLPPEQQVMYTPRKKEVIKLYVR